MKNKYIFFFQIMTIFSVFAYSQDGALDTSFDGDGFANTDFYNGWDMGFSTAVQDDGKIVQFGFAEEQNNDVSHGLVRYMPDGSLDTSFGVDGKITNFFDGYQHYFASLHLQGDQKIVASCTNNVSAGNSDFLITRYLPNGDLDPSFGNNGIVMTNYANDDLAATVLFPDGKFLAGGKTVVAGSENHILLAKYLSNGDLDNTFGSNGMVTTFINNGTLRVFGIKTQSDGKILVPYHREENFFHDFEINRYLENGDLDPSFGNGGTLPVDFVGTPGYSTLSVRSDGKFLISVNRGNLVPIMIQFLPNGDIDTSFGTDGVVELLSFTPLKLFLQPDGKILVCGNVYNFEGGEFFMSRYNANGTLDSSFGNNGHITHGFESADITLQNDGKILVAGYTLWYNGPVDFLLARFNNTTLGVSEFEDRKITVYPNPSDGIFTLQWNFLSDTDNAFHIIDITGKNIFSGILDGYLTQLDLSAVKSGSYFLKTSGRVLRLLKN